MLTTIYIVRHALRCDFVVDVQSGKYQNKFASPTGLDGDVPLASKGLEQAKELAQGINDLSPAVTAVYSSPFYRCLQTLSPYLSQSGSLKAHVDPGLGEFYGRARFTHPVPASTTILSTLFPFISPASSPSIIPSSSGESFAALQDRLAYAISTIIAHEDAQPGERAILICTHAASMIALGRVLTGNEPEDPRVDDFQTFTAGISTFRRRKDGGRPEVVEQWAAGQPIPPVQWKGTGVAGGWDLIVNSDTRHLRDGPERGWHFSGDEDYYDAVIYTGMEKQDHSKL